MSETITDEVVEDVNPLGESDEDFLKMEEPTDTIEPEIETQQEEEPQEEVAEIEEEAVEEELPEVEATTEEAPSEELAPTEQEPEATAQDTTYSNESTDDTETYEEEEVAPVAEIDYQAEYNKVMGGFKANGKDIKLNNVDDAVRLMQMGSDYHTKMSALKPNLKLLKMLDNNNLLDEGKLSYLIDLDKKDPNAITKLIKDSGIDPLDVDVSQENAYNPNTYTVSDKEVELDNVLQSIESSATYDRTIDVITNDWDEASKEVLYNDPSIIKVINDHIQTGVYDQINQVIENERMLGRLSGLSNLAAYKQVGDAIQANGGFAQQRQTQPAATVQSTQAPVIDTKIKDRKRAASSPKTAPSKSKAKKNFNPLSMSDEDFAKITESDFN